MDVRFLKTRKICMRTIATSFWDRKTIQGLIDRILSKNFDYSTKKVPVLGEWPEIADPWEAHEGKNAVFCLKNHKMKISLWISSLLQPFKKFEKFHSFNNWNLWKKNAFFERLRRLIGGFRGLFWNFCRQHSEAHFWKFFMQIADCEISTSFELLFFLRSWEPWDGVASNSMRLCFSFKVVN